MTKQQYARILDYFENKLSFEDEAILMQEISSDPNLQNEFELELMFRFGVNKEALLSANQYANGFETADEHIENVDHLLAKGSPPKIESAKNDINFWNWLYRYKLPVAAAALIVVAIVYYFSADNIKKNNIANDHTIKVTDSLQHKKDSANIAGKKDATDTINLLADAGIASKAYKKFYSKYRQTDDDPVEISYYYNAYRQSHYDEVIAAQKKDYQTRGGVIAVQKEDYPDVDLAGCYMRFYKGISLIEMGEAAKAIIILKAIPGEPAADSALLNKAQWYLALAYLKENKIHESKSVLHQIINTTISPYKKKAEELIRSLK